METNLTLDTKKFLRESLDSMTKDIDFCYPGILKEFEESRAHQTLVTLQGKIQVLKSFMDATSSSS